MASGNSLPLRTGRFVSDGTLRTIDTPGFVPKHVSLFNESNGARGDYTDTMLAGSILVHEAGTSAYAATGGITPTGTGFSVGTNAVVNTSGEIIHWVARA